VQRYTTLCALLAACGSDPTPSGTHILKADLSADMPPAAKLQGDKGASSYASEHPVHDGHGEFQLNVRTITSPAGGKYILDIAITVSDAAGYTVTAGTPGLPLNLGTTDAPIMMRTVHVSAWKSSWGGTTGGTTALHVHADGTVRTP
jgi:hypothetical protein